jgi:hypothetical protein
MDGNGAVGRWRLSSQGGYHLRGIGAGPLPHPAA